MAFEQAVSLLGALSQPELEQLGARIAALRALAGPERSPHRLPPGGPERSGLAVSLSPEAFVLLLYEAAAEALALETGEQAQPFGVFLLSRRRGREFQRAAASAYAQHAAWFPKATRIDTAILARLYVKCSLSCLRGDGITPCWKALSYRLGSLATTVEDLFPGYSRSGLLSAVLAAGKTVAERMPE